MYHCQLYHAPKKVKGLHLVADIVSLYLNIRTTIICIDQQRHLPFADLHIQIQFLAFCYFTPNVTSL